jgi:hypothetical protein
MLMAIPERGGDNLPRQANKSAGRTRHEGQTMWELLNRLDNASLVFLAIILPLVAALAVVIPVGMFLTFRQQNRLKEQEDELKREMIAKGMSAAEIERVIQATAGGSSAAAAEPATPTGPGFEKARLVSFLAEQEMDAVGIEKVLRALADYADEELPAKLSAVQSMAEQGMEADDIERVIRAFHPSPDLADIPPRRPTTFRE